MKMTQAREYRKHASDALKREWKAKNAQSDKATEKESFRSRRAKERKLKESKRDVFHYLLSIRAVREGRGRSIPDKDRAVVNEAIRIGIWAKYIAVLLEDYPRACKTGGIVDHIDHPIHVACTHHRKVVPIILDHFPESAKQKDVNGKLPVELYLENKMAFDNIAVEEFSSTLERFLKINPPSSDAPYMTRQSFREEVISHTLIPYHLESTFGTPEQRGVVEEKARLIARRLSMR